MIYFKEYITKNTLVGIWKIEETKEELLSMLSSDFSDTINKITSESRILEVLAVRVLLENLLGKDVQIIYNDRGKPYLADKSFHISISHTKKYVAIALNKEYPIGLDLEQIRDKILRLKNRIISDSEYIDTNNELTHLLLHWSAKEAMFKFMDAEAVDFIEHLFVKKFEPAEKGIFHAFEKRTMNNYKFTAYYLVEAEFVLVCVEEN